jgi:DNA sulfur modification protein DndD
MKLHSISLTNFLCYYGSNNKINFEEGLNLILGANGYGKSKLYDAFQWVFKDGITDDTSPGRVKNTSFLKKELISEKALAECGVGEKVYCEVIIEASDGLDRYQLKRKYFVSRKDSDEWLEAKSSSFEVYKKDVIHFKPVHDELALAVPNRLIGDEVMPYVWFQGEKGVNSIIDTSSKDALKRVIEKLSDIEKWDEYLAIVQKAATTATNDFSKELKTSNRNQQEFDELVLKQDVLNRKLDIAKEELGNVVTNHEAANIKFSKILASLPASSKIKELKAKKNEKTKELETTIYGIEFFQLNFTKRLFNDYWLLMGTEKLFSLFEDKYKIYSDLVSQRKVAKAILGSATNSESRLPRGIPERIHLQRMLEIKRCLVCDRPAEIGTKEYKAIESLLPELNRVTESKPNIEHDLKLMWNDGFKISDKIENAESEIKEAILNRDKLIQKKADLEQEIKNLDSMISNEITNSGIDESTDFSSMAEVLNQDMQIYSRDKGRLEVQIDRQESELKGVESRLKQLSVGNINPVFLRKKELLDDLVELTSRVKEKQYKGLVNQLETAANFHYENINKQTGAFYGKIRFVENSNNGFTPENYDDNGQRVSNPNNSQTSSLKLSIIMAIMSANKDRGYNNRYPLISDAPVSDFDIVKTKAFLIEANNTFSQCVIMIKDFLKPDENREDRYQIMQDELLELKQDIEANGKQFNVYQLDMSDGVSKTNRRELAVKIKPIDLV